MNSLLNLIVPKVVYILVLYKGNNVYIMQINRTARLDCTVYDCCDIFPMSAVPCETKLNVIVQMRVFWKFENILI